MEQTNAAYNEWINDECDKRIQVHLDSNNRLCKHSFNLKPP